MIRSTEEGFPAEGRYIKSGEFKLPARFYLLSILTSLIGGPGQVGLLPLSTEADQFESISAVVRSGGPLRFGERSYIKRYLSPSQTGAKPGADPRGCMILGLRLTCRHANGLEF